MTRADRTTIHDVASRAGVSPSTVSRVLNNDLRYMRDSTRSRVEDAIRELGFQPNRQATALRGGRTYVIGLIISDIANPFWPTFARGVQRVARREGYQVVLSNSDWDREIELECLAMAQRANFDGLIINPGTLTREDLQTAQLPIVISGWGSRIAGFDAVSGDVGAGIEAAIAHLAALGHTQIGFTGISDEPTYGHDRLKDFQRAMELQGLTVRPELCVAAIYAQDGGRSALDQLLLADPPPTAVLTSNDLQAIGMLSRAQGLGINVPEDLSIIGTDDIESASVTTPPLTTIRVDREKIGEICMRFLVERIEDEGPASYRERLTPVTLMVRGSTAPAKGG